MLAVINDVQLIVNQEKLTVELRVRNKDTLKKLEDNIDIIKNKYKKYKFYISLLKEKVEFENLEISDIEKLSKHLGQKLKLILQLKEVQEIQKNNKYIYKMKFFFLNKRKSLKAVFFSPTIQTFFENGIYIVSGKLDEGDPKFIKKNELKLGKTVDYQLKIDNIAEYEFQEKEIEKIYQIPRAELHCHTMFSKNDAFNTPEDYLKALKQNKCHSIAITDHGAVFAFIPFRNKLIDFLKENPEKKVILGSEMYAVQFHEENQRFQNEILALEEKKAAFINENNENEIEQLNIQLSEARKQRDTYKRFSNRKTILEEEKLEALEKYEEEVNNINVINEQIKELKALSKNHESEIIVIEKQIEKLKTDIGNTGNMNRDHINVLIKAKDEIIDYRGEPLTINPGVVQLYKLITQSYQEFFSSPTDKDKKFFGKRPVIPYHILFEPDIRKHFIITSACAIGRHMKYALEDQWEKFRKWIKNLDAVEIHPSWNNSYMVEEASIPQITKIEDVYALHRKIYKICKEENIPCIIVSDAHINNKEDRIIRSNFKQGYFGLLERKYGSKKEDDKRDVGDMDFAIERQPFIMSYDDVLEDYQKQGFTLEEIQEMHENSNKLAEQCSNLRDITLLPDKLFLPDFPNLNAKEELPKKVWEFAIKKWSKDGTKEGIDQKIRERIEYELELTAEAGYEVLYMLARESVMQSNRLGYIVGSRGSVGSMLISMCLGVSELSPLQAHYLCPTCKHIEWVEVDGETGLDLPDKECPHCHETMYGDGVETESHNFVGWISRDENGKIKKTKIPDIDLNFSENVQKQIHEYMINLFGKENAIKSGTQQIYQEDALKNDIFSSIPNIQEQVNSEDFDIDWMSNHTYTMRTTGAHPKTYIWGTL